MTFARRVLIPAPAGCSRTPSKQVARKIRVILELGVICRQRGRLRNYGRMHIVDLSTSVSQESQNGFDPQTRNVFAR